MTHRGLDPIPSEGRLNKLVRRTLEHAKNANLIATLSNDTNTKFSRPATTADAADARTLRGIPAIGRGVAGASPGTRPDGAYLESWDHEDND